MNARVLVTGAAGQLGVDLLLAASARGIEAVGLSRAELDITQVDAVASAVTDVAPTVIINAGAWTAVDACEDDPERADRINGTAVGHIVEAADRVGARVIQISTDYVFNGQKDEPYLETDATDPQSAYGRSKLLGEQAAAGHTVVRTSWVSGAHGANMVKTLLRLGAGDGELRFVDDQIGKPTFTADLAAKLLDLADDPPPGIFHITNERIVSWFTFAQEVFEIAGFNPARIQPIPTEEMDPPRPAPRPANSALANTALIAAGHGPVLRDFGEPLRELIAELTT